MESIYFLNVYSYFERQNVSGGGAERERERDGIRSRLQALNWQHRARRGAQTHRPWDHDLRWSQTCNQPSHPGAPESIHVWENNAVNLFKILLKKKKKVWEIIFIWRFVAHRMLLVNHRWVLFNPGDVPWLLGRLNVLSCYRWPSKLKLSLRG